MSVLDDNCWLPELVELKDYGNNWERYENAIYEVFKKDFIDDRPEFEEQDVWIRKYPMEYEKENAFFHVTCKDFNKTNNREPDIRRCERIKWIRSFIENYNCDASLCENCEGIKVWREPYKNKYRVNLLFEEEQYIVILEPRENYCLLITAFYIQYQHQMEKRLKKYEQFKP